VSHVIGRTIPDDGSEAKDIAFANSLPERTDAPSPSGAMGLVYFPVAKELAQVESTIQNELSSDSAAVETLLNHSRSLGGKRLRPALLLLAAKSVGDVNPKHIFGAAALEMIHLATLIHDDVLDGAKTRRHQETAHEKFGTRSGVLLGDYLFTHSFWLASKTDSAGALRMLAQASNLVCEGEISQGASESNFDLTESDYLTIVSQKTGELCAVACGMGVKISGADNESVDQWTQYGRNLGIAFQIIDDVLDLIGDPAKVGKTLGTDLQNRKPTLPVIRALSVSDDGQRNRLLGLLREETVNVEAVVNELRSHSSIEYSRQMARSYAQRAVAFMDSQPASESNTALRTIAEMMVHRAS